MPSLPRVLLKLSGEALNEPGTYPYSRAALRFIGQEITSCLDLCQIAVLTGAGNLGRGSEHINNYGMTPAVAHNWGMQATVLNMAALTDALEKLGIKVRPMIDQGFHVPRLGEPFIYRRAIRHLEKGYVVVLGGGAGVPGMTTDTAAVLRAVEIQATIVLKGTKVDGVFSKDPRKDPQAKLIKHLSYRECHANEDIRVIDDTAVTLAADHKLPIRIFNVFKSGNLRKILLGESVGSLIDFKE